MRLNTSLLFALMAAPLYAQTGLTSNPDSAALVTEDIPRFWRAFDHASLKDASDVFQHEYIDAGTPGLKDFIPGRITSGAVLAGVAASRVHYYLAIRDNTLSIAQNDAVRDSIRASFRRLKALYPQAVFPNVYFVIGRMNSGGTSTSRGLLIGAKMNARDDHTPVTELDPWACAVTGQLADLPHINAVARDYGETHEAALWTEFRAAMDSSKVDRWLYQGDRSTDRPADLGYWMGYKICAAYYARASDKKTALTEIIRMDDPAKILAASGYAPKP